MLAEAKRVIMHLVCVCERERVRSSSSSPSFVTVAVGSGGTDQEEEEKPKEELLAVLLSPPGGREVEEDAQSVQHRAPP